VVDGIHRQGIGPCEGAVGARGQHVVRGDEGGERHGSYLVGTFCL
jgi:hypothetical protein